jgi:hypothetical protein
MQLNDYLLIIRALINYYYYYYIIIDLNCKWVFTQWQWFNKTIRRNTQITHITQNNTPHSNKTQHTKLHRQ